LRTGLKPGLDCQVVVNNCFITLGQDRFFEEKSPSFIARRAPSVGLGNDEVCLRSHRAALRGRGVFAPIGTPPSANSKSAVHYQRLAGVSTVPGVSPPRCNIDGVGIEHLRQIIRDVVRDELRKLLPASNRPASLSIAEVVREEVQRACQPDTPIIVPAPEEPALSYAAMARRHTPVAPQPRRTLRFVSPSRATSMTGRRPNPMAPPSRSPRCCHVVLPYLQLGRVADVVAPTKPH
ncbi:hypothetical protein HPB47_014427, partial [Ixodes persulcatus]